ncbi:uncharacterized protein HMPREF1541_08652 [Cyphellophora europaea CBS 101466]|uniref:CorA-like transporter domain-containing protein n=1 Tax=Cyphellophora europaea (strain CBS 101466) TaxID=1220924 RepID=W2RJ87_CYPE1|nr:uncharacterized protein HMPREF1541_08652 [Cyphellophora europaea CBS 101466]ETN36375.1 hypothetical protein HMPREF1541_08652 [Cyphellophora europaea CBS 101466]
MDRLRWLYNTYQTYPKNLDRHQTYQHVLDNYERELQKPGSRLCCDLNSAQVDVWQCLQPSSGFTAKTLASLTDVHNEIGFPAVAENVPPDTAHLPTDPVSRYTFIHAPNSRERLSITKDMLLALMSYHQVMPSFLDILFCFGRQHRPNDFYYTTFRHECRLNDADSSLNIPSMFRSGQSIQLCYNLRSAELDGDDWKFRNTGTYHYYDAATGHANWILVRCDQSIKNKLTTATKSPQLRALRSLDSLPQRLQAALVAHLCLCEWSSQNFRAFVSDLEKRVHKETTGAHDKSAAEVKSETEAKMALARAQTTVQHLSHSRTFPSTPRLRVDSFRSLNRRFTGAFRRVDSTTQAPVVQNTSLDEKDSDVDETSASSEYQFEKMQDIERLEEQANAAVLIMKSNNEVLTQLVGFYTSLHKRADFPKFWGKTYDTVIFEFASRIEELQSDLRHQRARMETLLCLLADRKTLIHGIIQYRSMEASKLLAESTHQSALKMERITEEMSEVSRKTQKDTVSMRIITIITLIFLPGTFISTLMSTDIIRFSSDGGGPPSRVFSKKALDLFLIICLPLMFVTLMAWVIAQYIIDRRARQLALKRDKSANSA